MPNYDYIDQKTGEKVELIMPIATRDAVPGHCRLAVPPRLNTVGFAEDIHSQAYGVRRGLRDLEEKHGCDRLRRDTGMSVGQLQTTWRSSSL